jgi:AcrR family transcriptional regulator
MKGGGVMVTTGLRQRQRQQTHLAIRQAAIDLAMRHGVADITVADISQAAGVAQRTFFNHFRSKEDALVPEFVPFSDEAVTEFVSAKQPDLVAALEGLCLEHLRAQVEYLPNGREQLTQLMELVRDNPELIPPMMAAFEGFERRFCDLIARRTGLDPTELFCRVAAGMTIGVLRTALDTWRDQHDVPPTPDPDQVHAAFDIMRQMFSQPDPAGRPTT